MLIRALQTDHEDAFMEVVADLDWNRIASRLDSADGAELVRYLRSRFIPMCESVEDSIQPGGEYAEEERLDRRDRARECNRGFGE